MYVHGNYYHIQQEHLARVVEREHYKVNDHYLIAVLYYSLTPMFP